MSVPLSLQSRRKQSSAEETEVLKIQPGKVVWLGPVQDGTSLPFRCYDYCPASKGTQAAAGPAAPPAQAAAAAGAAAAPAGASPPSPRCDSHSPQVSQHRRERRIAILLGGGADAGSFWNNVQALRRKDLLASHSEEKD